MTYRLLPEAAADIEAITNHIAKDSPNVARRWLDGLVRQLQRVGEMPGIGAPRPEAHPELRLLPAGDYIILYREVGGDAEVVRVLHGARKWMARLSH